MEKVYNSLIIPGAFSPVPFFQSKSIYFPSYSQRLVFYILFPAQKYVFP